MQITTSKGISTISSIDGMPSFSLMSDDGGELRLDNRVIEHLLVTGVWTVVTGK